MVATAGQDGCLTIEDQARRAEHRMLTRYHNAVHTVAFSPDGQWLVSGGLNDTTLRRARGHPTPSWA
jgi:WD40 repeat protein